MHSNKLLLLASGTPSTLLAFSRGISYTSFFGRLVPSMPETFSASPKYLSDMIRSMIFFSTVLFALSINAQEWIPSGSNLYFEGGNVGIGTDSPSNGLLHIYKNATTGGIGETTPENAALRIQDNGASLYIDGNTFYTTGNMVLSTLSETSLFFGTNNQERLRITQNGNVGIGTDAPDEKLTVKGSIHSEEVKVDLNVPGPDYVFEADYDLRPLGEIAAYIKANKHLPEVPPAAEMEANGIELGEMNMLLLKKIEELTLHMIALKEENTTVKSENSALKQTIHNIISRVEELERE